MVHYEQKAATCLSIFHCSSSSSPEALKRDIPEEQHNYALEACILISIVVFVAVCTTFLCRATRRERNARQFEMDNMEAAYVSTEYDRKATGQENREGRVPPKVHILEERHSKRGAGY